MKFLVFILMFISSLFPAFERIPQSPYQSGSGHANFMPDFSPLSLFSHPASISNFHHYSTALFFTTPFQINNLRHYGASIILPFNKKAIGLGFHNLGNQLYRETTLSLGFARKTGKYFSIGILLNQHELSIKSYGKAQTTALNASMIYSLGGWATWSLGYYNLNEPKLGKTKEILPQRIATGFIFSLSSSLISVIEIERDLEFKSRYKFGVKWKPIQPIIITSGMITNPPQVTGSLSLKLKGQHISYAFSTHPDLSLSQLFTIQFSLP